MGCRVVVLLSGRGSNLQALLERIERHDINAEVVGVISNRPGAGGLAIAHAAGVTTACIDHREHADRVSFERMLSATIDALEPDLLLLAGFMRILTPGFIARYQGRMLNIHPSLLPHYKGLHTHARALKAGDTEHGCTVHEVTANLDDGPILGQARVPVLPGDTPDSLGARVLKQEHRLYPAVLARFAAGTRTRLDLT